jgi:hypothetical protein
MRLALTLILVILCSVIVGLQMMIAYQNSLLLKGGARSETKLDVVLDRLPDTVSQSGRPPARFAEGKSH